MIKEKIKRIQTNLRTQQSDTLLLANTGHHVHDDLMYYLLLTHLEVGVMCIPTRGTPTLYAIPFEVAQLKKHYPDIRVLPLKPFSEMIPKRGILAYRPSALPASHAAQLPKTAQTYQGEHAVMGTKLPEELTRLKRAAEITDSIFQELIASWSRFRTEIDVATYIHMASIQHGVEPSFPPIVASGKHAANPHHQPTRQRLKKGFCVIDMGVRYQGYCSDMTRTIYLGTPTKKERQVYELLLCAQRHAVESVRPGACAGDIDVACRQELGDAYASYFSHALGHGLGTQVHEWPRVSSQSDTILEEQMYITIEPGIYMPETYGMRIEDDVLVTSTGSRVYTTSPRTLLCLP